MTALRSETIPTVIPISRGADLTDADLHVIANDFYEVRNWAALQARMGPDGIKDQVVKALRVRLGRDGQVGNLSGKRDDAWRAVVASLTALAALVNDEAAAQIFDLQVQLEQVVREGR